MSLRISGQGVTLLPCRQLFALFFSPKGSWWESGSSWGGIGASRGFRSLNDAGDAFSAGHLLLVGLGTRASVRPTPGL